MRQNLEGTMSNLSFINLLSVIIYLSYAVFVLLRNRHSRHHQVFAALSLLFVIDSMSFFIIGVNEGNLDFLRLFITQSYIAETLMPPLFTWLVLIISQKYRMLRNGFLMTALFFVPALLIVYFVTSTDAYGIFYNSTFGGFMMWKSAPVKIVEIAYISLNTIFALIVLLNYGLKNIDFRARVLSKMMAVAAAIIFGYDILDKLQYLVYNEKIVPSIFHLVSLVGVSFMLYGIVKQKLIVFSSTVLSENILENLSSPVALIDERGKIVYYNQILQDITSYRPGEINGMSIFKLLPGLKMDLDELLNFGKFGIQHIRTNLKDAFGSDTKVIFSLRALHNHTGGFEGLVCTVESVNKPVQGQYDSRNQDERLLNAFEASDKGFWDWDIGLGELFFSETACRILGYESGELASLNFTKWREMLHYEFRDEYFKTLNKHLKQETDSFYMEYRVVRKNGDLVWILDKGRVTAFDDKNNPSRMSGGITDISRVKAVENELRKYKKKLEDALKFKNRLIDLLSTDIREPFNAIIGVSQVISSDEKFEQEHPLMKQLHIHANNVYHLINDVLNLAKIDEGRVIKNTTTFSLKELLDELFADNKQNLNRKGLSVTHKSNIKITLTSDRDILKKTISILLDNAIKFSNDNQNIDIYLEKENGHLNISVRDYGVGMSLSEQKRLFKIDESFNKPGTKGEGGHGLGLLIAKRLASIIDGKLLFKSSKNEGSEFTVQIPLNSAT